MTIREEAVGKFATAVTGQGDPAASGYVIAYSIVPQVLIEDPDGTRSWHRHDQVALATPEEVEELLVATFRRRWAAELVGPQPVFVPELKPCAVCKAQEGQ